jgi:hypothetical protein
MLFLSISEEVLLTIDKIKDRFSGKTDKDFIPALSLNPA